MFKKVMLKTEPAPCKIGDKFFQVVEAEELRETSLVLCECIGFLETETLRIVVTDYDDCIEIGEFVGAGSVQEFQIENPYYDEEYYMILQDAIDVLKDRHIAMIEEVGSFSDKAIDKSLKTFVNFNNDALKVLKTALYNIIDDYENNAYGTEDEYKRARTMYALILRELDKRGVEND